MNEDVFGAGQPFLSGFTPFPAVKIQECIGNQEVAVAELKPAEMSAGTSYAFRIRVQNPPSPPTLNLGSGFMNMFLLFRPGMILKSIR